MLLYGMVLTDDLCNGNNCQIFGNVLRKILNYMYRNEIEDYTNDDLRLVLHALCTYYYNIANVLLIILCKVLYLYILICINCDASDEYRYINSVIAIYGLNLSNDNYHYDYQSLYCLWLIVALTNFKRCGITIVVKVNILDNVLNLNYFGKR